MKSKEIENIISGFQDSNYRSILIDGPWGCGKTYQVQQFLKNKNKKVKVHYISLFGKETIDEINTELYRIINPSKFKTKRFSAFGLSVISKAISPIPYVKDFNGVVDAIGFSINNLDSKKIAGKRIIIFDDLERIDDKLSYISLMGYMHSLFLSGVRVICLLSSENINKDRKNEEFQEFKEKIFDRVFVIDEMDIEVVSSFFSNFPIEEIENIYKEFDNNLRQIGKTAKFYGEINSYANSKGYDLKGKISDLQLVRNCNQTIKICFEKNKKPDFDIDKKDNDIYQILYYSDVQEYGETIANGLYNLKQSWKEKIDTNPSSEQFYIKVVKSLINIFLFRNFYLFDQTFKPKIKQISRLNILDNNVFNLSDQNKALFVEEFFCKVKDKSIFFDSENIQKLVDIFRFTNYEFSDLEIDEIVELIFESYNINNFLHMDVGDSIIENINNFPEDIKSKTALSVLMQKISLKRETIKINAAIDKLNKSYQTNNFSNMSEFINKLTYNFSTNEMEKITEFILENNFLLPDLSGDISSDAWSYSHSMAAFANKVNKSEEFINNAIDICNANIKNYSLVERFSALIFYRIDSKYNLKENLKN